jgi:c-di-GMP-binding flagellar brake protein YcgR
MRERRRHKRIPIAASTTLTYKNRENNPPVEAMVANISISGIGLYSDKHIEKNADVALAITFVSHDGTLYN